jgi:hypothetical protein
VRGIGMINIFWHSEVDIFHFVSFLLVGVLSLTTPQIKSEIPRENYDTRYCEPSRANQVHSELYCAPLAYRQTWIDQFDEHEVRISWAKAEIQCPSNDAFSQTWMKWSKR